MTLNHDESRPSYTGKVYDARTYQFVFNGRESISKGLIARIRCDPVGSVAIRHGPGPARARYVQTDKLTSRFDVRRLDTDILRDF